MAPRCLSVTAEGPRVPAAAPATRSVPVLLDALNEMLNPYPMARSRLRHLAFVEAACLLKPTDPPMVAAASSGSSPIP